MPRVQIHAIFYENSEELLQFAEDLSRTGELLSSMRARRKWDVVLHAHRTPLLRQKGHETKRLIPIRFFSRYEEPSLIIRSFFAVTGYVSGDRLELNTGTRCAYRGAVLLSITAADDCRLASFLPLLLGHEMKTIKILLK